MPTVPIAQDIKMERIIQIHRDAFRAKHCFQNVHEVSECNSKVFEERKSFASSLSAQLVSAGTKQSRVWRGIKQTLLEKKE